jgi:pimeloyl-ACP methyl ester carboxylesterase
LQYQKPSELFIDAGRGVTLCHERFGALTDPPVILVMGLGQQLLAWPDRFCEALVDRGLQVIRFDNRDIGRSWHAPLPPPRRAQLLTRRFVPQQYTLEDMARDTAELIDALELRPAHIVGASMGGMIGQTLAAQFREHVRSLVSIMSSTGSARVGWIAPSTLPLLLRRPPRNRDQAAELALVLGRQIGSHGFPFDEQAVRDLAMRAFDRDRGSAAGTARQIAAILKSGDRTSQLHRITVPTLVVHGDRDRMVHPSGARATVAAIPGARLVTIPGLGHDLPAGAWSQLVELIAEHAAHTDGATAPSEVA